MGRAGADRHRWCFELAASIWWVGVEGRQRCALLLNNRTNVPATCLG